MGFGQETLHQSPGSKTSDREKSEEIIPQFPKEPTIYKDGSI